MVRNCASGIGLPDRNIAITKGHCGRIGLHYKIANCWIVTLAVRNGVTETGTKILDNLPMSIFGTCVNCYYSVRELHGEAIQAVGNHIKLVQAAPSDSMFANFICSM